MNTLYRFFADGGELLYVGRTRNPARRFEKHSHEKPWWEAVSRIEMEQLPTHELLCRAENAAIKAEKPRHNIRGNGHEPPHRHQAPPGRRTASGTGQTWRFEDRYGRDRRDRILELYWEVEGSSMSDDYWPEEISATELLREWWRKYGRNDYSESYGISPGVNPIFWYIGGNGCFESAPFCQMKRELCKRRGFKDEDFFTFFSWPESEQTGESLRFCDLPVPDERWSEDHADKGGFIQEALGWKPAPFQPYADFKALAATARIALP